MRCQIVDYRNFAHGRHFGLHHKWVRQPSSLLYLHAFAPLMRRWSSSPSDCVLRMESSSTWPANVLDLIRGNILGHRGRGAVAQRWNLRRPGAPEFGRRIYKLTWVATYPFPFRVPCLGSYWLPVTLRGQ